MYQDYNLVRQTIRLVNDAQIIILKKPNKYKVEEH